MGAKSSQLTAFNTQRLKIFESSLEKSLWIWLNRPTQSPFASSETEKKDQDSFGYR